jgi:pimeloyl-ACP methyl ester carboxylesterase
MAERFDVSRGGIILAGERWPGGAQTVLLLHEGVADRRGWAEVAGLLAPELTVVACDRRGYGQTPPGTEPFSHLDDLLAVIGHAGAGGGVAGRCLGGRRAGARRRPRCPRPDRGPGGDGYRDQRRPRTRARRRYQAARAAADEACAARDAGEVNRLETWLWLDGPAQPEGRVGGAARKLALDMNAVITGNDVPETEGAADVDAWHRLAEIKVPVTVACGDLDVPFVVDRCRLLAGRLPAARYHVLTGMAHQPYLESASTVAQLIRAAVTGD